MEIERIKTIEEIEDELALKEERAAYWEQNHTVLKFRKEART